MRVTTLGAGLLTVGLSLGTSPAAAQAWGSAQQSDPVPPSLLAPSDAPASTGSQVGSAPGLINPTGDLHGDADTSRYDHAPSIAPVSIAPVQTPGQYAPDAPPVPDRDGGPPRL